MTLRSLQDQAAAALQGGRLDEAAQLCSQLLALDPADFLGLFLSGIIRFQQQRPAEALVFYDRAMAVRPREPELLYNRGNALYAVGRLADAVAAYDAALVCAPGFAPAWNNRGNALRALERLAEAVASYGRVLALDPGAVPVRRNRADLLWRMERFAEALADYEIVVARAPGLAEAWINRGDLLRALMRPDAALDSYARAVAAAPGQAEAWRKRGTLAWLERGALPAAIADLREAVRLDPDLAFARGFLLHLRMQACDWRGLEAEIRAVDEGVRAGKMVAEPFAYLPVSSAPADLLACAEIFARATIAPPPPLPPRPRGAPRRRIRLGYVSGEFHEQATAHLTAGLYERHDRDAFEVIGFDNGPADGSALRRRLEAGFDRMVALAALPDRAAAQAIQAEEIDILVNLNGYFGRHRSAVFAQRPAPLQVNYLGFPGSMGMAAMDYLIADRVVIPEEEKGFYREEVVWLPHSYQINDDRRPVAAAPPDRAACGLPPGAFVFCNFNNGYKITPTLFALWLRLLAKVPHSVLWLLQSNPLMAANLRAHAAAAGIAPQRLVLAPFVPSAQNLARLALADLALDTLPVNAHTGASDLLWAGVPLLTCRGGAFSGRVAASLLLAAGMPELVTQTLEEYEALALTLAREPAALKALRDRLSGARAAAPLFDTARGTRDLEAAYAAMWDIFQRGEAPRGFAVPPLN